MVLPRGMCSVRDLRASEASVAAGVWRNIGRLARIPVTRFPLVDAIRILLRRC
jgi:hypothetical protein